MGMKKKKKKKNWKRGVKRGDAVSCPQAPVRAHTSSHNWTHNLKEKDREGKQINRFIKIINIKQKAIFNWGINEIYTEMGIYSIITV